MPSFVTGKELEEKITDIIHQAKNTLLIVSPFIKLDDYFKELFNTHKKSPALHIIIIFGKNEDNVYKSFNKSDFEYFKDFPNISIIYIPNLHAKYYGNEQKGIITSINLYDKSFEKNIEFGYYSESSLLDKLEHGIDQSAWEYCKKLANKYDVIFLKRPVYKLKLLGLSKDLVGSNILVDQIDNLVKGRAINKNRLESFPEFIDSDQTFSSEKPVRAYYGSKTSNVHKFNSPKNVFPDTVNNKNGFCIRCGINIPFNPEYPLCDKCFISWAKRNDFDNREAFCHLSGKKSFGKTTKRNPILKNSF